ncbi:MAG: Rdx family protein [Dehalococcoidales bacterium]
MNDTQNTIQITYCSECGLLEDAMNLAALIERGFGIPVTLKEGHAGIFEISMNDNVIYNNNNSASMIPTEGEVISIITKNYK